MAPFQKPNLVPVTWKLCHFPAHCWCGYTLIANAGKWLSLKLYAQQDHTRQGSGFPTSRAFPRYVEVDKLARREKEPQPDSEQAHRTPGTRKGRWEAQPLQKSVEGVLRGGTGLLGFGVEEMPHFRTGW